MQPVSPVPHGSPCVPDACARHRQLGLTVPSMYVPCGTSTGCNLGSRSKLIGLPPLPPRAVGVCVRVTDAETGMYGDPAATGWIALLSDEIGAVHGDGSRILPSATTCSCVREVSIFYVCCRCGCAWRWGVLLLRGRAHVFVENRNAFSCFLKDGASTYLLIVVP